eukprot:TRINITY_DN4665_c0_g1_i3.p1 TRINITY_DN4665_c0_g1~~TRINITY_DN4665_c0_g1_i3.p1  ORF type:complete len:278 (-),score=61.42 TRINITY_DN4665_c0_g1_i3:62-895(-)
MRCAARSTLCSHSETCTSAPSTPWSTHNKLMAILCSNFSDLLYLDEDNMPGRDPSYLFSTPEFRSTGAVFWPDMYSIAPESSIWRVMGVPYVERWAQESGQLLVDKSRTWRQLLLAGFLNQRQDFYYTMVNGDKDIFQFSWLATRAPFHMVSWPPAFAGVIMPDSGEFCGNSFVQHDTVGLPLFVHAVGAKDFHADEYRFRTQWEALKLYSPAVSLPQQAQREDGGCLDAVDTHPHAGRRSEVVAFPAVFGNMEPLLKSLRRNATLPCTNHFCFATH